MGIRLDWSVESDGGWNEVGEDPQARAARQRRNRRIRNLLLILLLLGGLTAALIVYRMRMVAARLRTDLEATVATETLALRIGDRAAFMAIQANVGGWLLTQSKTFDEYQALGNRLRIEGEIIEQEIRGLHARVVLREVLDGYPCRVVWFYEHYAEGWRHVPPDADFWGAQQQISTTYFDFYFYDPDRSTAYRLAVQLDEWWNMACRLTGCRESPPRPRVRIEPDPLITTGWAAYDEWTLLIPSPHLGRVPEDGSLDPALVGTLADLLAERWAWVTIGNEVEPYSDAAYVRDELHIWLRHQFDNTAPPSSFFDPLIETYGVELLPAFLDAIRRGEGIVPALQSLTGAGVLNMSVGWEGYFAHILRSQATLIAEGHSTEAEVLFDDPERAVTGGFLPDFALEATAIPDSIAVLGIRRFKEIAWAEVLFEPSPASGYSSDSLLAFEPFRLAGDRWVHTLGLETDWGDTLREQGQYFNVQYYELDAPYVEGLSSYLDGVYPRMAADLGLPAVYSPVEVRIQPIFSPWTWNYVRGMLMIPSVHVALRTSGCSPQAYIQITAVRALVENAVLYQMAAPANSPLSTAFIGWEIERLGIEADESIQTTLDTYALNAGQIDTLAGLWTSSQLPATRADSEVQNLAAEVLVDLLVEKYGPQAVPALLRNLRDSSTIEEWLYRSTGTHVDEIEGEWLNRFRAAQMTRP
jgi:hypothetical protein